MSHKRKAKWIRRRMIIAAERGRMEHLTFADLTMAVNHLAQFMRQAADQVNDAIPAIIRAIAGRATE